MNKNVYDLNPKDHWWEILWKHCLVPDSHTIGWVSVALLGSSNKQCNVLKAAQGQSVLMKVAYKMLTYSWLCLTFNYRIFFWLISEFHSLFLVCLCRRNLPGDRQKALDIMLPLVNSDEQVASDIYCLVGRIYKDMFLDSHFTDTDSRDQGIHWWGLEVNLTK